MDRPIIDRDSIVAEIRATQQDLARSIQEADSLCAKSRNVLDEAYETLARIRELGASMKFRL